MTPSTVSGLLQERWRRLPAAGEMGKKVVGFFPGNYVPEELIHAAGAFPLCLIQGGNASAAETGLEKVPQILCPFARSLLGEQSTGAGANSYFSVMDLVVAPLTCQHLKKVAEIWELQGEVTVFKLGVPFQHEHDFEQTYFADRIIDLRGMLESLTGAEVTRERLLQAIREYNDMRRWLQKISFLRRDPAVVVPAREFIGLNHLSYITDPREMTALLEAQYTRYKSERAAQVDDRPRILFMGPNIGFGDDKILQLVEAAGGRIVIEEFCEGMRPYRLTIGEDGDLIRSLARGYLSDRLPCAFMRDSAKQRLDFAVELIDDFKVDAVIWYELVCCETYDSEAYYFSREMEQRRIPFLMLESDYTAADVGQLRTRIEAFIEIVKGVV